MKPTPLFACLALSLTAQSWATPTFGTSSYDGNLATVGLAAVLGANGYTIGGNIVADNSDIWTASGATGLIIKEIAGWSNTNTLGWYDASNPTPLHQIFPGVASAGATAMVSFSPANTVGLYLNTKAGTWYSQDALNSDQMGHVATYKSLTEENTYLLGWEDMKFLDGAAGLGQGGNTDADYNDFIVKVTFQSVPEPATLGLFAAGMLGLAWIYGRRRRALA